MGPWIWFNLLMFYNNQWYYIDSFETLEICQEQLKEYEEEFHHDYYCLPHKVIKSEHEIRYPKKDA